MKKTLFLLCVVCLVLSGGAQAWAQASGHSGMPGGPPKVLVIGREEVKPGKSAAHVKVEEAYPRALAKAKWPNGYLGMTSMSGSGEALFLSPYDSFEAWEKDQQAYEKNTALSAALEQLDAKDGEFVSGSRAITALYREEMSYNTSAMEVPKARYFRVIIFRVRPGHDAEFAEATKIVRGAYQKLGGPVSWATYQVYVGMPSGTYIVFLPAKSLKEIDDGLARAMAVQEAEGEEGGKRLQKIATEAYLGVESNIYALRPKMSYVSKEFAAADPDFWTPKPKAAKPAAGAAEEKKLGAMPALPAKKRGGKAPAKM